MSKITIIEGNSNDKDQTRVFMVKGEKGDTGPQGPIGDNQLTIGTVTGGDIASAEIVGTSPNQTLNLVIPKGDKGDKGDPGDPGEPPSLLTAFPVGSIFLNADGTNPGTFIGGTWSRIAEGLFLAGVGTGTDKNSVTKSFSAGANNGEYEHTQTVNEMAQHNHNITDPGHTHNYGLGSGGSYSSVIGGATPTNTQNRATTDIRVTGITIQNKGGSQAMNVTPPSFGIYIWQRTA